MRNLQFYVSGKRPIMPPRKDDEKTISHSSQTTIQMDSDVMKIIRENWPLLQLLKECRLLFLNVPALTCRRNQNLRDILVRVNITAIPTNQTKCDKQICILCEELNSHQTLQNIKTKNVYNAHQNVHCKIHNIVYVLKYNNWKKKTIMWAKQNETSSS